MSKRTAVVVAGALGLVLAGQLFAEQQQPPSISDAPAGAGRTPQGLPNDNCEDAIPISKGQTPFDTTGANTDGLPHAFCMFDGQTYHDIWFQYTPTSCLSQILVSTCDNADYDTDLVVYDGCYPDMPCPPGDEYVLGCNDDGSGCGGYTSELTVPAVDGNCYTIRIGGWSDGDQGSGVLTVSPNHCDPCGDGICDGDETCGVCPVDCGVCVCGNGEVEPGEECDPPGEPCAEPGQVCLSDCTCGLINDNCVDAIPIFEGETPFGTTGADTDGLPHEFCMFDGQTYHDIWYEYTPTSWLWEFTVSTCNNADYDTDLVVYDGCFPDIPCPPGDEYVLGCNDDGPACAGFTSELAVFAAECNCYTIRVGGWSDGDQGSGVLTVSPNHTDHCGDGKCDGNENPCNCPQDCYGECDDCIFFDNQAGFEAFNAAVGYVVKCVEDFEESILPPSSVDLIDDPLCGGIPSLPDGFPFPSGLVQPNLCVQSNLGGEGAPAPNPRGIDGLTTASASPGSGPVSDIVVAGFFEDSLDLIFDLQENQPAIGFNTISLTGDAVHIRVFSKQGSSMLNVDVPADPEGTNFWGVWCPFGTIGRINIFDTCNGAEGADNIQIWTLPVSCGACATDTDGSGDTGASDLAVLLGLWGPCALGDACDCLDADSDCVIGAADLAALLGSWGPCP